MTFFVDGRESLAWQWKSHTRSMRPHFWLSVGFSRLYPSGSEENQTHHDGAVDADDDEIQLCRVLGGVVFPSIGSELPLFSRSSGPNCLCLKLYCKSTALTCLVTSAPVVITAPPPPVLE